MWQTGPQDERLYHMEVLAWLEQPKGRDKGQLCGYDQRSNQHCRKWQWWGAWFGYFYARVQRSLFFKTLVPVEDRKVLYMGNTSTVDIKGVGQVELMFTSGKTLTLNDVYYILEARKNLVSCFLLNKFDFKQVYEADKYILFKGSVFMQRVMLVMTCLS